MRLIILVFGTLLLLQSPAQAQQTIKLCIEVSGKGCVPVSTTNPIPAINVGG